MTDICVFVTNHSSQWIWTVSAYSSLQNICYMFSIHCFGVTHSHIPLTGFLYYVRVISRPKSHWVSIFCLSWIWSSWCSCLVSVHLDLCCVFVLLQMSRRSSKGKEIVTDISSPIAKRTRHSSQSSKDSNRGRFKTPLDSQTHSSIFEDATSIVERVVRFDTLGTTFIPRIFEAKD